MKRSCSTTQLNSNKLFRDFSPRVHFICRRLKAFVAYKVTRKKNVNIINIVQYLIFI